MAMPRKLKYMNTFLDGISYLGVIESVTLPKLTRIMKEWRGGGMDGAVKVDQGQVVLTGRAADLLADTAIQDKYCAV